PWTICWMKAQAENPDTARNLGHLRSFVHKSRKAEVIPNLLMDLKQMSNSDAHWILRDLQRPPKYKKASVRKERNSLEVPATLRMSNGTSTEVKALIDSGCTGCLIHKKFVAEKGVVTHTLPRPMSVYNANGSLNTLGKIEKFIIIEMQILDHKEQIALAVTNLG
ncbi:hypothetical protein J3R83DRAFT_13836, partial [Lanmaoa asiatica]